MLKSSKKAVEGDEYVANTRRRPKQIEQDGQQTIWNPVDIAIGEAIQKMVTPDNINPVPKTVQNSVVTTDAVTSLWKNAQSFIDFERTGDEKKLVKGRKSVSNVAKITLAEDVLEKAAPLGEFQRAVLEAVISELAAGNMAWSSSMLYRTMVGKTNGESVTPEQQKLVDDAMSTLMYTPLHIDLRDFIPECEEFKQGEVILDGPILPAERLKMSISGTSVAAYRITGVPIILRFCSAVRSITMTPIGLLEIDMNYTQRTIALLNAMQRYIAPLIYPPVGPYKKPRPLLIPYASLYSVAFEGSDAEDSFTLRKRVRENVHTILDTWASRGYIARWESIKEGRSYIAVRVHFPNTQPHRMETLHLDS